MRESRLLLHDVKAVLPSPEHVARLRHTLEAASARLAELRTSTAKRLHRPLVRVAGRIRTTTERALAYIIIMPGRAVQP
jgi:hypothetical protein